MSLGLYAAWFGVLGLVIGSFLNVVIYRVPAGKTLMGRSHCPACDKAIAAYDNIPVISWLILRGKCRRCGTKISPRYPLVELVTGMLFAGVAYLYPFPPLTISLLFFLSISIALFAIDIDTLRLPDAIVIPSAGVLAVLLSVTALVSDPPGDVVRMFLAALALAVGYFGLWFVTGGKGLGFGDVKLAPSLGLVLGFFGWEAVLVGTAAAWILGALIGVIGLVSGILSRGKPIPFGPFLLVGAWVGVVLGEPLAGVYLRFFGLA